MNDEKTIMRVETVLPEDFDGTFYFTNWSDDTFVGKWGGKEYRYAAQTSSKMVLPEHSPLEIQQIRKKFAKDLAEREFYKSKGYETLRGQEGTPGNRVMNSIHQAGTYSMDDLTPFIQRCLEPLTVSQALVKKQEGVRLEEKLSKNEDNELNTAVVKSEKDLEGLAKGTLDARVLG